jgi:hypothetical protein
MAAKASRIRTLLLLIALGVATLTATVTVAPHVVMASPGSGPCGNGDPDRPGDTAPKPTSSPNFASAQMRSVDRGGQASERAHHWSWAMDLIATLLGRHGL